MGDACQACIGCGGGVCARMVDEKGDVERLTACDFIDHQIDGLVPELVIGAGEIDEVGGVGDSAILPAQLVELAGPFRDGSRVQGLDAPLTLIFGKDLNGVHMKIPGFIQGVGHGACD